MPIALALIGALMYGAADFFGGLASKRSPTAAVVAWSQAIGFALLGVVVLLLGTHPAAADIGWGAVCGVFGAFGVGLLYRGLAIGTMGVVSPITAVLAAAIPVVYGIIVRSERPSLLAAAGIVAALVAVVCVSAAPSPKSSRPRPQARRFAIPPGIVEALGSGVGFGAFFICLAQTGPESGVVPILAARLSSTILIVIGGALVAGPASLRVARGGWLTVIATGALDVGANVLYVLAIHSGGMLSLVAVLTSLYPASTVALAATTLHERLGSVQWIGVGLALAGAVAIALAR